MIYIVLIAIIVSAGAGFYGGHEYVAGQWAEEKVRTAAALEALRESARVATAEASNKISDMESAYLAGEEKGRATVPKVVYRATTNIARDGALQNPVCKLTDESFALLTATLHGVRAGVTLPPEGSRDVAPAPVAAPPVPPPAANGRPPKPVPKKKAAP